MFTPEELREIDTGYFEIIVSDPYDVTIQSKTTGRYWYLHSTGYPTDGACVIFHKHRYQHPYHQHGRASTLRQAVKSIKSHDIYQIKVRGRRYYYMIIRVYCYPLG